MKAAALGVAAALVLPASVSAGADRTHYPPTGPRPANVPADAKPPFSASVLVGDTLYLSGSIDVDPATGKPAENAEAAARVVLDAMKASLAAAGMTMDELVWVQVFSTDTADFGAFGRVYGSYFAGPLPARSFVGVERLMGGARFEVNGIAVRRSQTSPVPSRP